ncbi:MAG: hypothetical protein IJZ25_00115 [Lachnospiraceae bacterium]|nr:hypothetical protein [Lachnospiraceae bacterium]
MLNFEEEVSKFSPSLEVDSATEAVYDNMNPDIADILDELLADKKGD